MAELALSYQSRVVPAIQHYAHRREKRLCLAVSGQQENSMIFILRFIGLTLPTVTANRYGLALLATLRFCRIKILLCRFLPLKSRRHRVVCYAGFESLCYAGNCPQRTHRTQRKKVKRVAYATARAEPRPPTLRLPNANLPGRAKLLLSRKRFSGKLLTPDAYLLTSLCLCRATA